MIIFSTVRDIPFELLEYKGIRQVVSYNLSSYFNNAPTLNLLVPSPNFISEDILSGDCSIPAFDISYHNYILENDDVFLQFMNIIVPAFMHPDVLVQIMIMRSPFSDAITESLLKLIQQRYGYNVYIINEIEDFIYTEESDFSIPGLFTIDQDMSRWRSLVPMEDGDIYE